MITAEDLRITRLGRVNLRLMDTVQSLICAIKGRLKGMKRYAKTFSQLYHNSMEIFAPNSEVMKA